MAKKSKLSKSRNDPTSRYWRNKADIAWSQVVRKDGKCAICGATEHLNAHHLLARENLHTRHEVMNGEVLCPKCHKFSRTESAHKNPIRFVIWLMANKPETWKWLLANHNMTNVPDRLNYKERYTALTRMLSNG